MSLIRLGSSKSRFTIIIDRTIIHDEIISGPDDLRVAIVGLTLSQSYFMFFLYGNAQRVITHHYACLGYAARNPAIGERVVAKGGAGHGLGSVAIEKNVDSTF